MQNKYKLFIISKRAILRAHIEVVNQLSNISNLKKSYDLKNKQVEALTNQ